MIPGGQSSPVSYTIDDTETNQASYHSYAIYALSRSTRGHTSTGKYEE